MNFIQKIKTWFSDHYHILFKSAAVNHLRIQELLKNPDGTYQLTVKFNSYSELKEYQKKVRRLTVSLSSAVAMVIVAFIVAPYIMNPNRSKASNFVWTQSTWKPTGNTGATANLSSPSNFDDYASKSNVDVATGKITLPLPEPKSTGDNPTIDANVYKNVDLTRSDRTGFYHSDANGNYSANGTLLALKKALYQTCASPNECGSGACLFNKCNQNLALDATCNIADDCASGFCNFTAPKKCQVDPWGGLNYVYVSGLMTWAAANAKCTDLGGHVSASNELYSSPSGTWYTLSGCGTGYHSVTGQGAGQACKDDNTAWHVTCAR